MRLISQLHTNSNCKIYSNRFWIHITIREPKGTWNKIKNTLVRNRIDGETLQTGMVNWKTRVYKNFLLPDLRLICTVRRWALWGLALCASRGEFHSTKYIFLHYFFTLCYLSTLKRERFPRFQQFSCCVVEFRSILLNKRFFFFFH